MEILIYEDNPIYREYLHKILAALASPNVWITATGDADEVKQIINKTDDLLLCFLDIVDENDHNTGFELAELAKKKNKQNFVAFLSGYFQRWLISPQYKLLGDTFITKRISEEHLKYELIIIFEEFRKIQNGALHIKYKGIERTISFDDIYKIETVPGKRLVTIYRHKGQTIAPLYLKDIKQTLDKQRFLLCDRGTIVNIKYIESVDFKYRIIYLANGETCFFSKRKRGGVLDACQYYKPI